MVSVLGDHVCPNYLLIKIALSTALNSHTPSMYYFPSLDLSRPSDGLALTMGRVATAVGHVGGWRIAGWPVDIQVSCE